MLTSLIHPVHLLIIAFNLFGLIVGHLGACLYAAALAWNLSAVDTGGCFTFYHSASLLYRPQWGGLASSLLRDGRARPEPLIKRWVNSIIVWPLPAWAFELISCSPSAT
jgi:hypothetical protein